MAETELEDTFSAYWGRRAVREAVIDDYYKYRALALAADPPPVHHGFQNLEPTPGFDPVQYDADNLPEDIRRNAPDERPTTAFAAADSSDAGVQAPSFAAWPLESKVCIVGAGVTGLYIAMILKSLNIPGLKYEILEGDNRIGGRMLTHYFSQTTHDYYDIGAMRFPELPIMKRTFDLFRQLDIPLIDYHLEGTMQPQMFNDIGLVADAEKSIIDMVPNDPFHVSKFNGGLVPDELVHLGASKVLDKVFKPFIEIMKKDFDAGMKELMKHDHMSTRQYLREVKKYDPYTIQWLETNGTSSNLFDQAFTESVIDAFDFGAGKWKCINGGTSLVTENMKRLLSMTVYDETKTKVIERECGTIETGKRVKKIWQLADQNLMVSVAGEDKPRGPYTTVFNTTSLGCLGRIDLTGLALHPTQKDAIRCLHYDDSAKVAIKFKYPWWIVDCGITKGGIGSTDLPIRTCVYPSYNIDDAHDRPAVILCSYTWAQDATRVGSLIEGKPSCGTKAPDTNEGEEQLKDLMFDNLARLHLKNYKICKARGKDDWTLEEVRKLIEDAYVSHHAHSWSHDPYMSGAFALFGPQQFRDIYPYLVRPTAHSRFHILGEHASSHHAWIVGSLESGYSGVYKFLDLFGLIEKKTEMIKLWNTIPEFKNELGKKGSLWLQVALGDPTSLFPQLKAAKAA